MNELNGGLRKTLIDLQKAQAGFRLVGVGEGKYEIRFKSGEYRIVKKKEFEQLKIKFPNWMTDF